MANINEQCATADVCRLCGKGVAFLLPIFSKSGRDMHNIATKIDICLPKLKISPRDELSKAICYKCMFILEQCSDFCTRATNANAVMKRQYSTTARPCSSSDETQMPPRKRIKPVHADKNGTFPRQSVSLRWSSMDDDITASGSSERSDDSLSCWASKMKIRTSTFKPSIKGQEKAMLGEGTAIYQRANIMKDTDRILPKESEAAPPKTPKKYKRNHRELVRNPVAPDRHTKIPISTSFDVTQKTIPKDKKIKALFESKWNEDPEYLLSPERDTDYESDTNKSSSSTRTTMSEMFGKAPRKKISKPKDQQVTSLRCVNSMQDSAIKKVPMWEQGSRSKSTPPHSNSDSDSCGGLTPTLGPQWCHKE